MSRRDYPYEDMSSFQYIGNDYETKGREGNYGKRKTQMNRSRSGRKKTPMDFHKMLKHLLSVSKEIGSSNEKYLIKLAQLTNGVEELRHDNQMLVMRTKELEKERNQQYERAESLEEKTSARQIELDEICMKLKNTQHVFQKLKKLQNEKIALLQYSHGIAEEKSKLVTDVEELKKQNGILEETVEELGEKLGESEKKKEVNEQRLDHFQNLERKNLEEYNNLKNDYEQLLREHDEVRQAKTQIEFVQEELLQAIKDVKIENEELSEKEEENKTRLSKLEKDDGRKELVIQTLEKELKSLQHQNEEEVELRESDQRARLELESLKEELEKRTDEIGKKEDDTKQTIGSLKEQVEGLRTQLSEETSQHSQLQTNYEKLHQSHLTLSERFKNLERVHNERSNALETSIRKTERSSSEVVTLREQIRQRDIQLQNLSNISKKRSEMENSYNKMDKKYRSLLSRYENLEEIHNKRTKTLESSAHQMENERQQILSMKSEIVNLKDLLEQKDDLLGRMKKEKIEESELLHSKVVELEENLEYLKKRSEDEGKRIESEYSKKVNGGENEILELKRQLLSAEGERDTIRLQFQKLKQTAESNSRSIMETNQRTKEFLERKLNEKNEQLSSFSGQINDLTQELDEKMRENQTLLVNVSRLKTRCSEQKLKRASAVKIHENSSKQIRNLKKEIHDWRERCEGLKKQLKKYSRQISKMQQLKNQLKSSYDVIHMLRKTNQEINSQFQNNTSVIQSYEEKISQLEYDKGLEKRVLGSEIDHLKNVNSQLSSKIKSITNHNLSVLSNTKLEF